jgi:hypothetical protein
METSRLLVSGAIQRGLLTLEEQRAEKFFGEPVLDLLLTPGAPNQRGSKYTPTAPEQSQDSGSNWMGTLGTILGGTTGQRGGHREGLGEAMAKSAARSISSAAGRQLIRGVLGSLLGGATSSSGGTSAGKVPARQRGAGATIQLCAQICR